MGSLRQTSSIRAARVSIASFLLVLLTPATALAAPSPPLAPGVSRAIEGLLREKALRTPGQRKLGSRLIHADRMRRGVAIAENVPSLAIDLDQDGAGRVLVDIKADVSRSLLERIESLGGRVLSSDVRLGAIRARLPLDRLEELAVDPEIRRIRPADRAYTRAINVSEGDGAHRANTARSSFGVDGTGVAVGVLSDGADALPSLVTSGDLPAGVTILPGQAGAGNEGAAMLEIVHDLAPGASLLFATAINGQASFANNILALRAAGADVIVDDVGYFAEAVFQDDVVAAAVDQVRADGALYFSAAGNSGNLDDGTAGVWEGDFNPGPTVNGLLAHDYGGGDFTNQIVADSPYVFTLHWADPLGSSSNDYDLFLTNAAGTILLAASTDVQNGAGDPFEIIGSSGNDTGRQLIIVRHDGSASRYLHLNSNRGRLEHATAGQTSGHAAARGAIGVAAVFAHSHTAGFSGTEPVATYSSDGPRRVFFEANGAPITPADFSASGGELRAKPDLAAADCVSTAAPGFAFFCGTSAAAPHAAAIAALLIERAGGPALADPAVIRGALTGSAFDIEAPGPDRDSGAGLANALAAGEILTPPECTVSQDCEDGLFCNGVESCQAGVCVSGAAPLCTTPTPICDETADACVACVSASDCTNGLFCDGSETCRVGVCVSGELPICTAPTALCDDTTASCVECVIDSDCAVGQCVVNACTSAPVVPASDGLARAILLSLLISLTAVASRGARR